MNRLRTDARLSFNYFGRAVNDAAELEKIRALVKTHLGEETAQKVMPDNTSVLEERPNPIVNFFAMEYEIRQDVKRMRAAAGSQQKYVNGDNFNLTYCKSEKSTDRCIEKTQKMLEEPLFVHWGVAPAITLKKVSDRELLVHYDPKKKGPIDEKAWKASRSWWDKVREYFIPPPG